jgi:hypothetical protein
MRGKKDKKDSFLIEEKDFSKWLLIRRKDVEDLIESSKGEIDDSGVNLLSKIYEWLDGKNKLQKKEENERQTEQNP